MIGSIDFFKANSRNTRKMCEICSDFAHCSGASIVIFCISNSRLEICLTYDIKQIFHAFLFNIRNYYTRGNQYSTTGWGVEYYISRVNNFDIKQKKTWNIYYMPPTPNKLWEDKG